MSVISNNILAGASGQAGGAAPAGYQIERSLRFNDADSAYLNRTPSSAGNQTTWTWSGWVKRSKLGAEQEIFGAQSASNNYFIMRFVSDDTLQVFDRPTVANDASKRFTSQVFRDVSAWYHIVYVWDTSNSTADDRIKLFVNGNRVTDFGTTGTVAQNSQSRINSTIEHTIGDVFDNYFNGYLADVHFIDGSTPGTATDDVNGSVTGIPNAEYLTDFGEYDANGVWQPKAYAGSYGTNGFKLNFSDNSSNAALGTDQSTNNNDWTVNNITADAPGLATAKQGMDVVTYTGTGSAQSITSLAFQPDFIWFKARSYAGSHALVDSVRGISKQLQSNTTNAESTNSAGAGPQSFDSNGFTLGTESSALGSTNNSQTYVAWCWKAGGTASSNTDGSITSQVSANTTYGFSIVSYTGDGSGTDTVGHGLNDAPSLVITKSRGTTGSWRVFTDVGGTWKLGNLNNTDAFVNATVSAPTSSVFSIDGNSNASTTHIAYCWSEVAGFSKFGSYTGNGSTTGPVVTTGFKPRYLLIKRTDTSGNWIIYDSARDTTNPRENRIVANSSNAEVTSAAAGFNFLLDGFQATDSNVDINASSGTYIYAAFADKPSGENVDSLFDSPTNGTQEDTGLGGEVSGNYATWNPLKTLTTNNYANLSNGNLTASNPTGGSGVSDYAYSTIPIQLSGKWYFEMSYSFIDTNPLGTFGWGVGLRNSSNVAVAQFGGAYGGSGAPPYGYNDGSSWTSITDPTNKILQFAVDADAQKIWLGIDNTWVASGDPANGTNPLTTYSAGILDIYQAARIYNTPTVVTANFGQRAFAYTAPSGFKALNTANLPDPTIADGSDYMDVVTRAGGGVNQSFATLSPGLVWEVRRDSTSSHYLFDVNRGNDKYLSSNTTAAEGSTAGALTFNANSYVVSSAFDWPASASVVDWVWDAGTSTVSNTDGSITSQVRANQSAGFSIVTWTATTSTQTVGHGLNAAPSLVVMKNRSSASNWAAFNTITGSHKLLYLNLTNAEITPSETGPTSSVFTVAQTSVTTGTSGNNMIAYCFAPVEGYSAFGSYTGNGSTDGPFVFTGFRPAFVLYKRTDSTSDWYLDDYKRDGYNFANKNLYANLSNTESTGSFIDFLSNGFKLRTSSSLRNASGGTYLYACFSENPFKNARAR